MILNCRFWSPYCASPWIGRYSKAKIFLLWGAYQILRNVIPFLSTNNHHDLHLDHIMVLKMIEIIRCIMIKLFWKFYDNSSKRLVVKLLTSSIRRPFRPLLWRWRKMAALPLLVAILDDIISDYANEAIQDGSRMWKGRHFPPPPQWGSKRPPKVLVDVISGAAILMAPQ